MANPVPGATFGHYQLLRPVKTGGMAEIWEARLKGVEGFERTVALKIILPEIAADKQFSRLFVQEAKIAVALGHAHIGQVYELGKVDDRFFIAMEFIAGQTLLSMARRAGESGAALPASLACYVGACVADALDYAHRKQDVQGNPLKIVHRDVTPQNIMVSYEGEVKLIDFGVASAASALTKTQPGIIVGKFGYMSPEQVRGRPLDGRSDVFSLGIALHEVLTGRRLFAAPNVADILSMVRAAPIPPPSTLNPRVPEAVDAIVLAALDRNLEARLTSSTLAASLRRVLALEPSYVSAMSVSDYMRANFGEEIATARPIIDTREAPSSKLTLPPLKSHPSE